MVLRPDSGDPTEAVLMGLKAAEKTFGAIKNSKGYKVLKGVGVIQGDGINYNTMSKIIDAVIAEGYSAETVTFGMGGGLLQRVNRDTMSFATKLAYVQYADGTESDVMKMPTSVSPPSQSDLSRRKLSVSILGSLTQKSATISLSFVWRIP